MAITRRLMFYRLDLFVARPSQHARPYLGPSSGYSPDSIRACLPRLRSLLWKSLSKAELRTTLPVTFCSILNKSKDSQDGTVVSAKRNSASHDRFHSKTSEDTIEFIQLEELKFESFHKIDQSPMFRFRSIHLNMKISSKEWALMDVLKYFIC